MKIDRISIEIIADHHEKNSGVIEVLRAYEKVTVDMRTLQLGDYRVDDLFLFERKTLPDFITSIIDGRIFRQGVRLASSSLRSVLILEGTSESITKSGMRREAIQGALITISLCLGIPVLRSVNPEETARLILYAARQIKTFAVDSLPRRGIRPKGKRAVQLHILQGLPGVGPKRAKMLLSALGSVEAVLNASADELKGVGGVGKKTVETIRWAVSETENLYVPNREIIFPT
jgi:DNA excision repair protein ERCC-4